MSTTLQPTIDLRRAELRGWYADHLRPMLLDAVKDGILEQAALEHLDFELAELFARPEEAA